MAKPAATEAKIEEIRARIIRETISLINETGFAGFSMRRLGSRLGVAAKTIYNYFRDKDELYLRVLSKGFSHLCTAMTAARDSRTAPRDQLRSMAHAYVRYGLENPKYYAVLFSMDLPRFQDYIGTRHEPLADAQNRFALKIAEMTRAVMERAVPGGREAAVAEYRLMQLWSSLHGVISLSNSRVTLEVGAFSLRIGQMVDDAVDQALVRDG